MRLLICLVFAWTLSSFVSSQYFEGKNANKRNSKGNKKRPGGERKKRFDSNPQKLAMEVWASSLSERDYNYDEWRVMFHSKSTAEFFNGYASKISKIFKENDAKVNFAMVGACDGTGDNTIKYIYVPNNHWRGVFVEPMSLNVRDLVTFMAKHNISQRSIVIKAAATDNCKEPTIKIERPLYEEKNKSTPHWLRRQINSILPANRDHARAGWTVEEVRCMNGQDILNEWTALSFANREAKLGKKSEHSAVVSQVKKRRPHVLKIDVEGHDYEVLMGFLTPETPVSDLPLIIDFEAKSIGPKYPAAKERMEALGYAVSPFSQDGFAILKADRVFESIAAMFSTTKTKPAATSLFAPAINVAVGGKVTGGAAGEEDEDKEESEYFHKILEAKGPEEDQPPM